MMHVKHLFKTVLLLVLCAAALSFSVHAGKGWYCPKSQPGQRPAWPYPQESLSKYHAYYLGPDEKTVYLTFDAGYENGNVEKIRQVLKRHGATGTFFVLKHFVTANTELVKALAEDGNLIGNHTLTHPDISTLTAQELQEEVLGMEKLYLESTGLSMAKLFRPPQGSFSQQALQTLDKMGYKTVFWSVAYADWDNDRQPEPQKALDLLLSRMHNGAIVLLHPTSATNAAILDQLLTRLEEQGYRFGSLEELT